ncbi:hypothetical protein DRE_00868 [Drechslerella stenobrocha 248]|uniref:SET domain-containing protein n=1 Tax=Drechslerella stenobrocha 248 TaxID=1043628 RepID=W7HQR5_9PEZI|nr:hypothetical protein DRE_00868 [Drechslerella stenobrocha 248]
MSTPTYHDQDRAKILVTATLRVGEQLEAAALSFGERNPFTSKEDIARSHERCKEVSYEAFKIEHSPCRVLPDFREPANPSIPIDKLKKIHAKDLIVGKHHKGCYLKVRLVEMTMRIDLSIQSAFEDEQGSYGLVRFYYREEDTPPDEHLPYGYIVIIRDPFLWGSGQCDAFFVRVDHPHDVQYLYPWDDTSEKLIPSIWKTSYTLNMPQLEDLLKLADIYYHGGEYHAAIQRYNCAESKASKLDPKEPGLAKVLAEIYYGRAGVYVKLRQHLLARPDVDRILKSTPNCEVGLHLQSLRYYYTGKYELCQEAVNKALPMKEPSLFMSQDLFRRAKERHEEVKHGIYNWKGMRHKASGVYLDLDHADYTHPVKLKKTPKGRRVFTTRDIKRGDLLMAVKAIAIVPLEDNNCCLEVSCRDGTFDAEFGVGAHLTQEVIECLNKHPPDFYEKTICLMEDGGYTTCAYRLPDGTKVPDAFHIEEIRRRNCINISNLPLYNPHNSSYLQLGNMPLTRITTYHSGLWFLPSFLRHSCIPNAHRTVIGDMMIIRAGRDIPRDTKITIGTTTQSSWEYPLTKFVCTCPVHAYDVNVPNPPDIEQAIERAALWQEFTVHCHRLEQARKHPEKWVKLKIFDILPEMLTKLVSIQKLLPPPSELPQIQIAHRFRYIAGAYYGSGQRRHASCAYYKVLDCMGVEFYILEIADRVVFKKKGQSSEDLLHTYRDLAGLSTTPGIKRAWHNASVEMYEILYGERTSYSSVVQIIPFVEAKEPCLCVGIDNVMKTDISELKKKLGIDLAVETEWISTPDALAMTSIMNLGAQRSWIKTLEADITETKFGARGEGALGWIEEKATTRARRKLEEQKAESEKLLEGAREKEKGHPKDRAKENRKERDA